MWLFTQRGFFSIVQHKGNPAVLIVKARVKGDIEKYWPEAVIERNEEFDYLYRTNLPREAVEPVILQIVKDINYDSFKGSLEDKRRYAWYVRVWETLCMMQTVFWQEETENGLHDRVLRPDRNSPAAE